MAVIKTQQFAGIHSGERGAGSPQVSGRIEERHDSGSIVNVHGGSYVSARGAMDAPSNQGVIQSVSMPKGQEPNAGQLEGSVRNPGLAGPASPSIPERHGS